jgi:IS30 family transposase
MPEDSSLAGLDHDDLELFAASVNDRPGKTLDYATPVEAFNTLHANLASGGETRTHDGVRHRL